MLVEAYFCGLCGGYKWGCFVWVPIRRLPNNADHHDAFLLGELRDIGYWKHVHRASFITIRK